jgi:hypothetical protein
MPAKAASSPGTTATAYARIWRVAGGTVAALVGLRARLKLPDFAMERLHRALSPVAINAAAKSQRARSRPRDVTRSREAGDENGVGLGLVDEAAAARMGADVAGLAALVRAGRSAENGMWLPSGCGSNATGVSRSPAARPRNAASRQRNG